MSERLGREGEVMVGRGGGVGEWVVWGDEFEAMGGLEEGRK